MTTAEVDRRRIVVGVDGSKSSVDALLWAQLMGTTLDAEIDAVSCWQFPVGYGASPGLSEWDPATDAATILAHTLRLAYGDAEPAGLTSVVSQGHPASVLVSASSGAELLVVGSRGHGGFVGLLIGATSSYCAEHATCSVLVVHDAPSRP